MELKTFQARTMSDALAAVKAALGPDAIVVSTKAHAVGVELVAHGPVKLSKPVKDVESFRATSWAPLAAAPVELESRPEPVRVAAPSPKPVAAQTTNPTTIKLPLARPAKPVRPPAPVAPPATAPQQATPPTTPPASADVQREIGELKAMLTAALARPTPAPAPAAAPAPVAPRSLPERPDPVHELLAACDVLSSQPRNPQHARAKTADIRAAALAEIESALTPCNLADLLTGPVAIVGPCGAGKTTLTAKLASYLAIELARTVSIVNLDPSKGGPELAPYAEALDCAMVSVPEGEDLTVVMEELSETSCTLIDTPGVTLGDERSVQSLASTLREIPGVTVLVALPATMSESAARRWLGRAGANAGGGGGSGGGGGGVLASMSHAAVLLTRIDEAGTLGHWTRLGKRPQIGALSEGPRVSDPIVVCSARKFAERILASSEHGIPIARS